MGRGTTVAAFAALIVSLTCFGPDARAFDSLQETHADGGGGGGGGGGGASGGNASTGTHTTTNAAATPHNQPQPVALANQETNTGRLNVGSTNVLIEKFGICRWVDNNSNDDLLVPLNSQAEWEAFIANAPGNITRDACCPASAMPVIASDGQSVSVAMAIGRDRGGATSSSAVAEQTFNITRNDCTTHCNGSTTCNVVAGTETVRQEFVCSGGAWSAGARTVSGSGAAYNPPAYQDCYSPPPPPEPDPCIAQPYLPECTGGGTPPPPPPPPPPTCENGTVLNDQGDCYAPPYTPPPPVTNCITPRALNFTDCSAGTGMEQPVCCAAPLNPVEQEHETWCFGGSILVNWTTVSCQ